MLCMHTGSHTEECTFSEDRCTHRFYYSFTVPSILVEDDEGKDNIGSIDISKIIYVPAHAHTCTLRCIEYREKKERMQKVAHNNNSHV